MRVSSFTALFLSTALAVSGTTTVHGQEAEAFFRAHLPSPILFSADDEESGAGSFTISLQATDPFEVTVDEAMGAIDLGLFADIGDESITAADLDWSVSSEGELPPGVVLDGSSLVGTPTAVDSYDFEIVAAHVDAEAPGQQTYTIVVNGVELEVVQIAAGRFHTCAITPDQAAYCWGYNYSGRLGDGTTTSRDTPVRVRGVGGEGYLIDVTQIVAGFLHTCAVSSSAGTVCWGHNDNGQLGDGSTADRHTPVRVRGVWGSGYLTDVTQIAAGSHHTCAVSSTAGTICWGRNHYGQIGDASTADRHTPVRVRGVWGSGYLTDVTQIAAGRHHTCAVSAGVGAVCWGRNNFGQIGDGSTTNRHTPVRVRGIGGSGYLADVTQVTAGQVHTCAVSSSAGAVCWGYNGYGQLGDGSAIVRNTPVQVHGVGGSGYLAGVIQIAAGRHHTCAVSTSVGAVCWGYNDNGQLGDGSTTDRDAPVRGRGIDGRGYLSDVTQIAAGAGHTCAVSISAGTFCWGHNAYGQLGDDSATNRHIPVRVVDFQ